MKDSEMPGRAGSQQSELHEETAIRKSTGTRNSQRVDYVRRAPKHRKEPEIRTSTGTRNGQRVDHVRKAPKHRREPELRKHRKFDSSEDTREVRHPEAREPGESKTDARSEDRNRYPLRGVQDAELGAGRSYCGCSQGEEPEGPEPKC
jgi:hypothetical protein